MKCRKLAAVVIGPLIVFAPGAAQPSADTSAHMSPGPQKAPLDVPHSDAPLLRLTLNEGPESAGDAVTHVVNSGRATLVTTVITGDGGRAVRVPGRLNTWALRLPTFGTQEPVPRAVIRVQGVGHEDQLEPGSRDFRFGAAWMLDENSSGSSADNGDNLVQRGLHGSGGQFKLQIDHRVPSCRVEGDQGAVIAEAPPVSADTWYRVRCVREGDEVTIRLWELTDGGAVGSTSGTAVGPIGSVDFERGTPLSIGGKLTATGELVSVSGDQFNGVADNVVYDLVD